MQRPGTRAGLAGIALYAGLVFAGLPCICTCASEAGELGCSDAHASMSGHGQEHGGAAKDDCPSDSPCMHDQVPGVATHPEGLIVPDLAAAIGWSASAGPGRTPTFAATPMTAPAADRSPPIPPGFATLRI